MTFVYYSCFFQNQPNGEKFQIFNSVKCETRDVTIEIIFKFSQLTDDVMCDITDHGSNSDNQSL